ncbi:two-component sensor histidine kinase [Nocardioides szechwanensis]|uniref:histidine kinase n=1 Tax=Nocardioides szechwanensis TaxID=1005944 RepID=A0A1G9XMC3_9ACTN|nr:histidine kinase [Nocardioides szechwanensis]GEP32283.1 two-component sensor histidine kinase [Nocardioides szechwanensis]SDM97355.1 Signal transduction histidine kinase [Nocardioides szechwanensis]
MTIERGYTVRQGSFVGARRLGLDALLAVGCFTAWLPLLAQQRSPDLTDVLLLGAATAPLAVWRLAPLTVFVVTAVPAVALAWRGEVLWPPLGPCLALYLLAASREGKSRWNVRLIAAVVGLLVIYLGVVVAGSRSVSTDLGHALLAGAVAWFAGERTRLRRQELLDLHDRMRRSEDSAERELQLAVAEERTQIARDLHDSVGHALTLITVRAGAARLRRDPDAAITALTDIETIARDTTADIEQIVSPLRGSISADHAPVGLASVETLVAQFRAAGHEVALTQPEEVTGLSVSADQGAFRIIQESLTNAARHGSGPTTLSIGTSESALLVTITNPVAEPNKAADNGRHGVTGMRERARLLGGSLVAEEAEGEFRVELRLPRQDAQP